MKPKPGAVTRARAEALKTLHRALDEYLPAFKERDLRFLRQTLPATETLQRYLGAVAPPDYWRRARIRVDEELSRRRLARRSEADT